MTAPPAAAVKRLAVELVADHVMDGVAIRVVVAEALRLDPTFEVTLEAVVAELERRGVRVTQ